MMEVHFGSGAMAVSASLHGDGAEWLVLSHGAGGTRRMPWLVAFADELAARGRTVLLHNVPASEAGRRRPDPPAVLEAIVAAGCAFARDRGARRVVAGGRSMGGRMASRAVADGLAVDGLLLLAYPLHPPGDFVRLRDAHLGRVGVPTLFVQGTRDPLARFDLLEAVVGRLGDRARIHVVEGGNHGFSMPRGARRAVADVRAGIVAAVSGWIEDDVRRVQGARRPA